MWIRLGGLRVGQVSFRNFVGVRDQQQQLMSAHFFPFLRNRPLGGVSVGAELLHKARPWAIAFVRCFAGRRRMPMARRPAKDGGKIGDFWGVVVRVVQHDLMSAHFFEISGFGQIWGFAPKLSVLTPRHVPDRFSVPARVIVSFGPGR